MEGIFFIYLVVALAVCFAFGAITSNIAKKKGHSAGAYFAIGFFLGIIGLIIALVIEDKNKSNNPVDVADSLLKYKKLLDEGVITEDEFAEKKKQLMSESNLGIVATPSPEEKAANSVVASSSSHSVPALVLCIIPLIMGAIGMLNLFLVAIQSGDFAWVLFELNGLNFGCLILLLFASAICLISILKTNSKPMLIASAALAALCLVVQGINLIDLVGSYGSSIPVTTFVTSLGYPICLIVASAISLKKAKA
ncbi:MAG: SHOCT domain-containing protein [Clostridia bacterium]|nr:SHOCT domain-containing protein [Clostridia bacterium]